MDAAQDGIEGLFVRAGADDLGSDKADHGIGLIDRAVGFDPCSMLCDTAAIAERRLTLVAAARINFCQLHHIKTSRR